jgi:methyl-accepting chemotaxis protein
MFIEKAFQLRFMLKVIGVIALGTALTGGFLYLFGNYQISRMYSSAHFDIKESWEVFRSAVLLASLVSMTLVAILSVFFTLYDSHKIGGPLYRFRMNLEQIGRGDLTLLTSLRDGDELRPFVESMNLMTGGLRTKLISTMTAHEKLRSLLAQAKASGKTPDAVELSRLADEVSDQFAKFKVDS